MEWALAPEEIFFWVFPQPARVQVHPDKIRIHLRANSNSVVKSFSLSAHQTLEAPCVVSLLQFCSHFAPSCFSRIQPQPRTSPPPPAPPLLPPSPAPAVNSSPNSPSTSSATPASPKPSPPKNIPGVPPKVSAPSAKSTPTSPPRITASLAPSALPRPPASTPKASTPAP